MHRKNIFHARKKSLRCNKNYQISKTVAFNSLENGNFAGSGLFGERPGTNDIK